jgi:hypothetical protein
MFGFIWARIVRWFERKPTEEKEQIRDRILAFQIGPFGWLLNLLSALLFGGNLKILASIYMTDKWNPHWYAQHYEDFFTRIRHKKINILEIGVGGYDDPNKGGNSLRMWRTFFPNGHVYGVDIYDKSRHNQRRIKTFRGSQTDQAFLDLVVSEIGKVDIIIDDGSHMNDHILITFQHLFPRLADGGFYVIEDIQTSYWKEYGGNETGRSDLSTAVGYFESLIDGLNWEEFRGSYDPSYLDLNIKSIAFFHNMIFIRKGSDRGLGPTSIEI